MPIRLSGMISGMDTESLISQLVSAKSVKTNKLKKSQIKASWKQDAWKDLNSKIQNFQNKFVNNMRFTASYMKKTTKVSDSSAVSVITSDKAMNGVQEMTVDSMAKTAYMTGGKLTKEDGTAATALTKLSELDGFSAGNTLSISAGTQNVNLDITDNTTISDVLNSLKDAGLNASFDENQQRFYISAKDSGEAGNFSISMKNASGESDDAALSILGLKAGEGENDAKYIKGENAKITLNGVQYTSNSNTFEINGLTLTANKVTPPGEKLTISTQQDTDGIYDMIKNFVKEYNTLINEMDKLYNASSASKYDPLLTEEKEAMSDTEVEEWEKKIKDSLLRRDENLSDVSNALQSIMGKSFTIGDQKLSLASFGIGTGEYLGSSDNEKHMLHIDGDADDSSVSGKEDKLRAMISASPDAVVDFFKELSKELYTKMTDMSKSKDGYRSFGSFYDDKMLKSDYDSYASKISDAEQKLNDYEDKWYKKFAKMESAMAKLQSGANAVSGLFGGN